MRSWFSGSESGYRYERPVFLGRCYFINARISKLESNCNEANREHLLNSFVHVFRKFSESN